MKKLKTLDLFAGIGGLSLGLREYCHTVAYCELDAYCQSILLERMASNDLDRAPIWDDVTQLNRAVLEERGITEIDLIVGGFPCQDVSIAGHGRGLEGERSGLFYEYVRLVSEINPRFVFIENVAGLVSNGLGHVVGELSALGYDCRWATVSAGSLGFIVNGKRPQDDEIRQFIAEMANKAIPRHEEAAYVALVDCINALAAPVGTQTDVIDLSRNSALSQLSKALFNAFLIGERATHAIAILLNQIHVATGKKKALVVEAVEAGARGRFSKAWLHKMIDAGRLLSMHPQFKQIKDIEKLVTIARLPEDKIKTISDTAERGAGLKLGNLDLVTADRAETTREVSKQLRAADDRLIGRGRGRPPNGAIERLTDLERHLARYL